MTFSNQSEIGLVQIDFGIFYGRENLNATELFGALHFVFQAAESETRTK